MPSATPPSSTVVDAPVPGVVVDELTAEVVELEAPFVVDAEPAPPGTVVELLSGLVADGPAEPPSGPDVDVPSSPPRVVDVASVELDVAELASPIAQAAPTTSKAPTTAKNTPSIFLLTLFSLNDMPHDRSCRLKKASAACQPLLNPWDRMATKSRGLIRTRYSAASLIASVIDG
ncbi:MAG: hypothetical protein OEM39_07790 [Acidimicrobiia bacterium]|nr:hypothetical protein [Acidimicrobiia bacterium]